MGRLAVLFPGQGAQFVGMGRELADKYRSAREVYEQADEALGFAISAICFEGPDHELVRTANTQPAILATSVAVWQVLKERGVRPAYAAGLSLGEYSAHVAAGSIKLAAAVDAVRRRGEYMQQSVPEGEGGMAAVMGLSGQAVAGLCQEVEDSGLGLVRPANYNCPGQVVISGHRASVEAAARLARERGASRAVQLAVSAPFHCPLMEPAQRRLARHLSTLQFSPPDIAVIANSTGRPVVTVEDTMMTLIDQVVSPVRWEESIRWLADQGVTAFLELGPGTALSGLVRRIDRSLTVKSVLTPDEIESALDPGEEVC